jgi:hypothetical protein
LGRLAIVAHFYFSPKFNRLPRYAFALLTITGMIGLLCFGVRNPGWHRLFIMAYQPRASLWVSLAWSDFLRSRGTTAFGVFWETHPIQFT